MRPASQIPALVTAMAACLIIIASVFVTIAAQSNQSDSAIAASQSVFSWFVAAAGFITLVIGIVYGFVKKQKYANLETERNELKSLAESREERIKELKYTASEAQAKHDLKIAQKEQEITNFKESNKALVSVSLQMKAILRKLRIEGHWQGHEEEIHETQG